MDVSNSTDKTTEYRVSSTLPPPKNPSPSRRGSLRIQTGRRGQLAPQRHHKNIRPPAGPPWKIQFFKEDTENLLAEETFDGPSCLAVLVQIEKGCYKVLVSKPAGMAEIQRRSSTVSTRPNLPLAGA